MTEKKLWLQSTDQQEIWKERPETELEELPNAKVQVKVKGEIPILRRHHFGSFYQSDFQIDKEVTEFLTVPVSPQFETQLLAFEATIDFPWSGSLIIAEKLPDLLKITGNECYLILTKSGLIYRRVYNQLKTRGVLVLTPEVHNLASIDLPANDILSIWKPLSVISYEMPEMKPDITEIRNLVEKLRNEIKRFD